jgi:hypothetical protein
MTGRRVRESPLGRHRGALRRCGRRPRSRLHASTFCSAGDLWELEPARWRILGARRLGPIQRPTRSSGRMAVPGRVLHQGSPWVPCVPLDRDGLRCGHEAWLGPVFRRVVGS